MLCMICIFAKLFIAHSLYITGNSYHVSALLFSIAGSPIVGWLADVYIGRYQFILCSLRVTCGRELLPQMCII